MNTRLQLTQSSRLAESRPGLMTGATVLLVLALVPLLAGATKVISGEAGLMLGSALVVGAAVQAGVSLTTRRSERMRADRLILHGQHAMPEVAWRVRELTSPGERRRLAQSLRSLAHSVQKPVVMTAQVVNRPAVRPHVHRVILVADRLAELDQPVGARGVLLVDLLLRDSDLPLYNPARAAELPEYLDVALRALGPSR